MENKKRILIVDDKAVNRDILIELLGADYIFLEAEEGGKAVELLKEHKTAIDMVILDLIMPGKDGFSVLEWLLQQKWRELVPVMVVSADERAFTIDKVYELGAQLYMSRPYDEVLTRNNVESMLRLAADRREVAEHLDRIEYESTHDPLTGLLNHVIERQESEKLLHSNSEAEYVMAIADVDNFKQINSRKGSDFGNKILKEIADRLKKVVSCTGIVSRIGGDQFVLLDVLQKDIFRTAEAIHEALTFELEDCSISICLGLVSTRMGGRKYNDLFLSADHALFDAKRNGRNSFVVYRTPGKERVDELLVHEDVMNRVSQELPGGFFIYYANASGKLIYVNDALVKLFGCDNEQEFREMVGDSFYGIVYPDDIQRVEDSIRKQINQNDGAFDYVEYRIKRKDGTVIWLEDHGRYVFTEQYGYVYYVFVKEINSTRHEERLKVLVADDQEMNRKLLTFTLEGYYDIEEADSGRQTIEMLTQNPDRYAMLLLDLVMPEVDGFQVLEFLNKRRAELHLPVIVISADTSVDSINRAFYLGALDVVSRPYKPETIRMRVRNCIELFMRKNNGINSAYKRRILIIDDSTLNRSFLSKMLDDEYDIFLAGNGLEAQNIVTSNWEKLSLIILDMDMPVMNGYEFLEWMKHAGFLGKIPVIAETIDEKEDENLHCLYAGASDYLSKPYKLEIVKNRVASVIRQKENANLLHAMKVDQLTGVYSNQYFNYQLQQEFQQNKGKDYDVIWTNIESFKLVNERYGSQTGDDILKYIGGLLRRVCWHDLCMRISADHFVFVVRHEEGSTAKLLSELNEEMQKNKQLPVFTIKYGVYEKVNSSLPLERIYDRAMVACGRIKDVYGEYVSFYDEELRKRLIKEQQLIDCMEDALRCGQFKVYYQPKHSLKTGKIVGMEALVRWIHPEMGFISPGDFIPLFERNGFIPELDMFVFETVCKDIRSWMEAGLPLYPVSINASRHDFLVEDYLAKINEIIDGMGISRLLIHMEVTESMYMENAELVIDRVKAIRESGICIEMDDFGSGYSSLGMLGEIPLDIVKLDISFVRRIDSKIEIIQSIINLVHELGMKVVAEGTETQSQIDILRSMGCDYVQGYFYSRPLPKAELEEYVKDRQ